MTRNRHVQCECNTVMLTIKGKPKVTAYCHCKDCRDLLQVPFHAVLAWEPWQVEITQGLDDCVTYQHPAKKMKRIFCKHCGDVLYNTNAMNWKLISQWLYRKCNGDELPKDLSSEAHFYYSERVVDIDDELPKKL